MDTNIKDRRWVWRYRYLCELWLIWVRDVVGVGVQWLDSAGDWSHYPTHMNYARAPTDYSACHPEPAISEATEWNMRHSRLCYFHWARPGVLLFCLDTSGVRWVSVISEGGRRLTYAFPVLWELTDALLPFPHYRQLSPTLHLVLTLKPTRTRTHPPYPRHTQIPTS